MSSKIIYNDGEGIDFSDFNLQQDLDRRRLFDSVLWHLADSNGAPSYNAGTAGATVTDWDPGTTYGSLIRPLRQAGMIVAATSTNVLVQGGLFIQISTSPLDPDQNVALIASADTVTSLSGIVAAAGGLFRRDLIQCRLLFNDVPQVSRDFKDAVTAALSSQLQTKRSNVTVEFSMKSGTESNLAFASNSSNLTTADAGWQVIGAILVDDTGVSSQQRHIWDYRLPWGYWKAYTTFDHLIPELVTAWVVNQNSNGHHRLSNVVSQKVLAFCPTLWSPTPSGHVQDSDSYNSMRIDRIDLLADWGSAVGAGAITLSRNRMMFDAAPTGLEHIPGNLADAAAGEVGVTRVGPTAAQHIIYQLGSYPEDPPLWSNGFPNPFEELQNLHNSVLLEIVAENTDDRVYGVEWSGWGGF